MDIDIAQIKNKVNSGLSKYFGDMSSNEFEGTSIYPSNSLDLISIFLAVSADCDPSEIICEFSLSGRDDLAEKYSEASYMIGRDDKLVLNVLGVARGLGIDDDKLVL